MSQLDEVGRDLKTLTAALDAPYGVVTTVTVDKARAALQGMCADAGELAELEAMLSIDDQGVADGIARGLWTPVPA